MAVNGSGGAAVPRRELAMPSRPVSETMASQDAGRHNDAHAGQRRAQRRAERGDRQLLHGRTFSLVDATFPRARRPCSAARHSVYPHGRGSPPGHSASSLLCFTIPSAAMSLRARVSSASSLARLVFDVAVGLVLAIPTVLVHALVTTFPNLFLARLVSHMPSRQLSQHSLHTPHSSHSVYRDQSSLPVRS